MSSPSNGCGKSSTRAASARSMRCMFQSTRPSAWFWHRRTSSIVFLFPAFRIKHDVVPGTYETLWFKATKPGIYKLECTQYCGLQHATMKGEIVVMSRPDYARWLTEQGVHESLARRARRCSASMAAAAATASTARCTRPRSTASTADWCICRTVRCGGRTSAISATASSSREPSPSPATRRSCRIFPARSARTT